MTFKHEALKNFGKIFMLSIMVASCRNAMQPSEKELSEASVMATQQELQDMIRKAPLVEGPFSEEAIALCKAWRIGKDCENSKWGLEFVNEIRSFLDAKEADEYNLPADLEPNNLGLTQSEYLGLVSGEQSLSLTERQKCRPNDPKNFAYGPFTKRAINMCRDAGGGKACYTNCWDRQFYEKIAAKVKAQKAPVISSAPQSDNDNNNSSQQTQTAYGEKVDLSLGERFARTIRSMTVGFRGRCWQWVNDAIVRVTGYNVRMGSHSGAFLQTVKANPSYVKRTFGLCLSSNRNALKAPVGSVMIYTPGYCGFHRKWGHGEIKVSNTVFCSDGCMNTASFCQYPSAILVPCGRN